MRPRWTQRSPTPGSSWVLHQELANTVGRLEFERQHPMCPKDSAPDARSAPPKGSPHPSRAILTGDILRSGRVAFTRATHRTHCISSLWALPTSFALPVAMQASRSHDMSGTACPKRLRMSAHTQCDAPLCSTTSLRGPRIKGVWYSARRSWPWPLQTWTPLASSADIREETSCGECP